jgi:hypothetical protein
MPMDASIGSSAGRGPEAALLTLTPTPRIRSGAGSLPEGGNFRFGSFGTLRMAFRALAASIRTSSRTVRRQRLTVILEERGETGGGAGSDEESVPLGALGQLRLIRKLGPKPHRGERIPFAPLEGMLRYSLRMTFRGWRFRSETSYVFSDASPSPFGGYGFPSLRSRACFATPLRASELNHSLSGWRQGKAPSTRLRAGHCRTP